MVGFGGFALPLVEGRVTTGVAPVVDGCTVAVSLATVAIGAVADVGGQAAGVGPPLEATVFAAVGARFASSSSAPDGRSASENETSES